MVEEHAEVTVHDAARRSPDTLLIDVRGDIEWAAGHAPGALHISLAALNPESVPRAARVLCICHTGRRSEMATTMLRQVGINASNVKGGMVRWASSGLPVVRDDDSPGTVL